MGIKENLIVQ